VFCCNTNLSVIYEMTITYLFTYLLTTHQCDTGNMLQILQLVRMNGKLRTMDLHTRLTWCDSFAKLMATTSLLLSVVSIQLFT